MLSGHSQESAVSPPTAWWQHAIGEDIIVWVRAGVAPWRMKQVRTAVDEFARQVAPANSQREEERETK
jgi:hypothetical protein